ncbi:MAG: hypothetical protein IJK52_02130 [Oscillospiraceae bacterium]|nr:hypothetical protein [Oscillospiraceae bacterium]
MSRVKTCCDCGKRLKKDEIALTRKLVDMDAEEFYCMDCLSEFIGCSEQDLKEKIQEFKEQGCTLFL